MYNEEGNKISEEQANAMRAKEKAILEAAMKPMKGISINYINEALRTASGSFHGELVGRAEFSFEIAESIHQLEKLDRLKKLFFYGEDSAKGRVTKVRAGAHACQELLGDLSDGQFSPRAIEHLLHGIIGAATECGELLEALSNSLLYGKKLDAVNIKEEVGDIFWYLALIANAMNFTFEEAQQINIEKLRARFPYKFTETNANNRDLETERSILENGYTPNEYTPNDDNFNIEF